ncbi:integrase [Mesorhizobium sp. CAU 1732]|uniref:integrase n=1 Tax=Mesorhizobium sp. CAU 1732 TaxID=3140358 RepID=UPI0032617552
MRRADRADRHLQKRTDGGFRYVRRVPSRALTAIRLHDPDYPEWIRRSLDTQSRDEARAKRDAMEQADDSYWATAAGGDQPSQDAHARAVARARSMKIDYRPVLDLANDASIDEIIRRLSLAAGHFDRATFDAALGTAGDQTATIDEAFSVFQTVIRRASLAKKSPWQRLKWRQLKQRGIANFKRAMAEEFSDVDRIAIESITRSHALKFHAFWLARIVPESPEIKPLSPSAGNKDMDTMRALFGEYMAHIGREAVPNPFRGLRFEDDGDATRPPFSEKWLRETILAPDALAGLNDDARLAVLVLINTGARPSEIVNLPPDCIVLDAEIPYIDIRPAGGRDPVAVRELKAKSSLRRIPLAGVSLDAMKQARHGFPRYRDRDNLSAAVNKYFRENDLMETPKHTLYSLRHGFEARLKLAEVDEELRRYLMGHAIKRPKYGYSDDLRWAYGAIEKVAL